MVITVSFFFHLTYRQLSVQENKTNIRNYFPIYVLTSHPFHGICSFTLSYVGVMPQHDPRMTQINNINFVMILTKY